MIKIAPCNTIPMTVVGAVDLDDPQAALTAVVESAVAPTPSVIAELQALAQDMPLLHGRTLYYAEISQEKLAAASLSDKDRQAVERVFFDYSAYVVPDSAPIMFLNHARVGEGIEREVLHHELVHAEQAIRGDSLLTASGQVWQGELYDNEYLDRVNLGMAERHPGALYHYLTLPWEEEAYRRSEGSELYEKKREAAALRSFFHGQMILHPEDDPCSADDYSEVFGCIYRTAVSKAGESLEIGMGIYDAYDDLLVACHIDLDILSVSELRRIVHDAIKQRGEAVPFPVEEDFHQAGRNLYLACRALVLSALAPASVESQR